jgi:rod shape-determining protein MreD
VTEPVHARVVAVVALLVLLHFFFHVGLSLGAVAPDLLTIGLLIVCRQLRLGPAALLGLVFGLLEDSLSAVAFGANSIAMTLVGIGGALTRDFFVGDSRLFLVLYFLIGKWMRDFIHWTAAGGEVRPPFVEYVLMQGAISGAYAALVGLAIVTLLGVPGESS